ncbi:MAG: 2-hydroxychromene-2-carboxylate isomerase [Thalassobaculales bacterium]
MSDAPPIDFYFDFSSPYGYFAAQRIDDLARLYGRAVIWHPILLGVVFKTTGQVPLLGVPLKGDYARRDLARVARLMGVPFITPATFPFGAVAASRITLWLRGRDPALAARYARAVYARAFAEGGDVVPAVAAAEIAGSLGVGREEALAANNDPAVKDLLRQENEAAMAAGVFGSPFVIVDGEPFWGWDRLDMVERWLSSGGW